MKSKKLLLAMLACCMAATTANAQKYLGGDISMLPEYETAGSHYYTSTGGSISNVITYLKDQGMNSMRVRLFVDPSKASTEHKGEGVRQDLEYVKKLGKRIKDAGLHFLLDIHYSDTWTDPGQHSTPDAWKTMTVVQLNNQVYTYTKDVLQALKDYGAEPDAVQVGNEVNVGMLWNLGKAAPWNDNQSAHTNFLNFIKSGVKACREICPNATVVFHVAMNFHDVGNTNNNSYVRGWAEDLKTAGINYDVMGISYYPYFHGPMSELSTLLTYMKENYSDKKIQLVEMGYPHAYYPSGDDVKYDYKSTYPDTNEGQRKFTADLITLLNTFDNVNGLYWWWPEANEKGVDWHNPVTTSGWYNMGLWDNSTGKATPALYELKNFINDPAGIEQITNTHHLSPNTSYYDLQGRKVAQPKQGLYIVNGKKVVVK